MSEKDTIAKILAEMRQQSRDGYFSDAQVCGFADRIEAANRSRHNPQYDSTLIADMLMSVMPNEIYDTGSIRGQARKLRAAEPAESAKDWSLRMSKKEVGQTVSAGAHGLKDKPAPFDAWWEKPKG